eukprot:345140-Chlamydomonas_euryale.AAC.8
MAHQPSTSLPPIVSYTAYKVFVYPPCLKRLRHVWIRLGVAFWVAVWQPLKHELAAARVD